jgi:hypothetical protein
MAMAMVIGGNILIVLDEENIERIQQADPFELDMRKMGTATLAVPFKIHICYAKKDDPMVKELTEKGDLSELLKYLSRGYKVTASDHDRGYDNYATLKAKMK